MRNGKEEGLPKAALAAFSTLKQRLGKTSTHRELLLCLSKAIISIPTALYVSTALADVGYSKLLLPIACSAAFLATTSHGRVSFGSCYKVA